MMPYRTRNRSLSLRPVNRIKHVFDSQFGVALDTNEDTVIISSTDTPTLAAPAQVETGSTVKSIFLVLEVLNNGVTGILSNVYMMIFKNPGNNLTFPNPNVVGVDDNKKYVFHQEMVMLQPVHDSNPRTLFKGVIKIPRHLQRNGPNDRIIVRTFSPGIAVFGCLQCHYKEYR